MAEFNINNWIAEQQAALGNMARSAEDGSDVFDEGVLKLQQSLLKMDLDNKATSQEARKLDLRSKELDLEYKKFDFEHKKFDFEYKKFEAEQQQKLLELKSEERKLAWKVVGTGLTVVGVAVITAIGNGYCTRLGASCEMASGGFISSPTLKNGLPKWKDVSSTLLTIGTKAI